METTVEKNHVRAVARAGPVLRTVTGVALVLLAFAVLIDCSKPTKPQPATKYLLYAGMAASTEPWDGFIAIIDCEIDSIIDSVMNPSSVVNCIVSPDGRYFAMVDGRALPQIFDAVTRLPIKFLNTLGTPLFLPDAGLLLCPDLDSTLVYNIPGFEFKESWPRPRGRAQRVPGRQQIAAIEWRGHDRSKLMFFDYVSYRAVDSLIIDPDPQDIGFRIFNYTFSHDGMRFYATGEQSGLAGVVGYDLRTRKTLFRQSLYGPYGYCRVTPDGREVWVTDPGFPIEDFPVWPQTIFIYDAVTGALVDTVSLRGISPNPYEPLAAQDIRFLPDGSKAYVNCGSGFKGLQPILVINTSTRRVDRLIFGGFRNLAESIDIAPRP